MPKSAPHERHHTNQPKRDHHGDRHVPPPATFDLYALPDTTLLSEREIAALLRVAVSTVQTWRQRGHPLPWMHIGQGRVRYRAGDLRQFLASGEPRRPQPKSPATKADAAPPAPRRASRASARPRAKTDEAARAEQS